MRKFYYMVAGYEFFDGKCFGQAWKDAKTKATELHTFVARRVEEKGKDDYYEYYLKGGAFLPAEYAKKDSLYIF